MLCSDDKLRNKQLFSTIYVSTVINKTICQLEDSFPNKVSRKLTHAKQFFLKERKEKCTIIKWHIFLSQLAA